MGIIIDDKLCFDSYMNYLQLKLKARILFQKLVLCLELVYRFLSIVYQHASLEAGGGDHGL